jgi:hypothetical protein
MTEPVLNTVDEKRIFSVLLHYGADRYAIRVPVECDVCVMYIDQDTGGVGPLTIRVTLVDNTARVISVDTLRFERNDTI